jgi:hypothetical protein
MLVIEIIELMHSTATCVGGILPVKNVPGTHEFDLELEVKASVLLGRVAQASPYNLDRTGVVPKLNVICTPLHLKGRGINWSGVGRVFLPSSMSG